jgi:hypothetical protein
MMQRLARPKLLALVVADAGRANIPLIANPAAPALVSFRASRRDNSALHACSKLLAKAMM